MSKIIIMVCSLLLFFFGVHDACDGWKHPASKHMTVAEFVASDQSARWVVLTDAKLNLRKATVVTKERSGEIKKLYVPIESEEFFQKEKVSLLLNTEDEELLQIAAQLYLMTDGEQLGEIVQNRDKLLREVELSGTMCGKGTMNLNRVKKIRSIVNNLDEDFRILHHDANMNLTRGLIFSGVALLVLVFTLRRKKKSTVLSKSDTEVV
ncbi:MAG: hypothetical protein D3924_06335 [Candidatus Electrothrix sp. AR4]|nr:hypothetical protein [Candidatus Electrothrix sp. AR4]